ncbi:ATP synthase subunit O, mitochondrial-like [Corylus avellana]|uniref:ATP synthase subunit O, mitochondrial-like n=1 Tax=Corylus avellana TaxID=13451 RepID=UPI00286CAF30|nr:ATP synthase subunit O, mitochondrial-like [Corylus avellana]
MDLISIPSPPRSQNRIKLRKSRFHTCAQSGYGLFQRERERGREKERERVDRSGKLEKKKKKKGRKILEFSRNYATTTGQKEEKVKVPLAMFGGSGNYASALYIAAVKGNALEKVESELLDLVEASKKSPTFAQFAKDLSVPADTRVKALQEISAEAKFSDLTKNFLALLAENGRLTHLDSITKRFVELTMALKGEVKVIKLGGGEKLRTLPFFTL